MAWELKSSTLDRLWTDAYPRIVGRKWYSQEYELKLLADQDEPNTPFILNELKDLGVDISGLQIELMDIAGNFEVEFYLDKDTLHLPWPSWPSGREILENYMERGCRLPGLKLRYDGATPAGVNAADEAFLNNPAYPPRDNLNLADEHNLLLEAIHFGLPDGLAFASFGEADLDTKPGNFRGDDLRGLFSRLPEVIAYMWEHWEQSTLFERYKTNPSTHPVIADLRIPSNMKFKTIVGLQECVIKSPCDPQDAEGGNYEWIMELPLPTKPSDGEIFKAIMTNRADNPLYSLCPTNRPC